MLSPATHLCHWGISLLQSCLKSSSSSLSLSVSLFLFLCFSASLSVSLFISSFLFLSFFCPSVSLSVSMSVCFSLWPAHTCFTIIWHMSPYIVSLLTLQWNCLLMPILDSHDSHTFANIGLFTYAIHSCLFHIFSFLPLIIHIKNILI